jgi:hypothetical protein
VLDTRGRKYPALISAREAGRVRTPAPLGNAGRRRLARVTRPQFAVFALDRLTHDVAKVSRKFGKAKLEARGLSGQTP